MKLSHLAILVVTYAVTVCAEPPPATQTSIIQRNSALEVRAKEVQSKVEKLDTLLTRASRAGTLKSSTEIYFRECLERFRPNASGLLDWEKLYYPPKFDTDQEMEVINLAWDDLHLAANQMQEEAAHVSLKHLNTTIDLLRTAARSAEKPEDLEALEQSIVTYRQFPNLPRNRYPIAGGAPPTELLVKLATGMHEVLKARQAQDTDGLVSTLQHSTVGFHTSIETGRLPIRVDTLWEEFRARMVAPLYEAMQPVQRDVESQLIARKPAVDIEKAIATFEAKATQLDKLSREPRPGNLYPQEPRLTAVPIYRKVLDALYGSERGRALEDLSRAANSLPGFVSRDFKAFISSLTKELDEQRRLAGVTAETQRRAEADEADRRRKAEDAKRIALEQEEARKMVLGAIATVRTRILAIRSAQDAQALADALPDLLPLGEPLRHPDESFSLSQLREIQQELRQVGTIWSAAGEIQTNNQQAGRFSGHAFVSEIQKLRETALRDVVATRYAAPELQAPPLSEMPVQVAVNKLAAKAARESNWKRSLDLLQAASSTPTLESTNERIKAIRSYLVGLNFEQAEQFREAIDAYQSVLQQVADHTPVKESAERLKALRAAHPEAFPKRDAAE